MRKFMRYELTNLKVLAILITMGILLLITDFRPNINSVSQEQLQKDIVGVGKIKATQIVHERDFREFSSTEDFYNRIVVNTDYKVGDKVYSNINKKYKIK